MTITLADGRPVHPIGGTQARLIEDLALPDSGPLVEWHRWGDTNPPPPTALSVPIGALWRYRAGLAHDPATYAASAYDDSAWTVGPSAFGDGGYVGADPPAPRVSTLVTQDTLWTRLDVVTLGGALTFTAPVVDNLTRIYLDGALVADWAYSGERTVTVPCPAGEHVVAVYGYDDGQPGGFYCGVAITEATGTAPTGPPAYTTTVLEDTPLVFWRLDETAGTSAGDTSGNARAGTHSGGVTLGAPTLLGDGTGHAADYTTGQTRIPYASWMNVSAFTVEALVQPDAACLDADYHEIAARDDFGQTPNTNRVWKVSIYAGRLLADIWTTGAVNTWGYLSPAGAFTAGVTHHVAVTYDGTTVRGYIDGVETGSFTKSGTLQTPAATLLSVGNHSRTTGSNKYFDGRIQGFAFGGTALPAARIAAHHAAATTTEPPPEDPPAQPEPVPGWVLDPTRTAALAGYNATHGRPSATDTTGPSQAAVQLARPLAGAVLPTVGERFRLTLSEALATALALDEDERPRFTGEVTDVSVDVAGNVAVTGIGRSRRLGQVLLDRVLPEEDTGARVTRILDYVRLQLPSLEVGTIDPGGPVLISRPADPVSAGQLVDQVVDATTGQLVEHRNGRLDWHGLDHRRGAVSALELTGAAHLLRPFTWAQRVGTVINDAVVSYSDPPATVRVTDPTSTDPDTGLGPMATSVATELRDQEDAYSLGSTIVGRRSQPAWELPAVVVDLERTAGPLLGPLLALTHGDLVDVAALPADGPWTASEVFVEGTTERFTRTAWQLSLAVADPTLAGVAMRWLDVPADVTWDSIDPELTWLDLARTTPADL